MDTIIPYGPKYTKINQMRLNCPSFRFGHRCVNCQNTETTIFHVLIECPLWEETRMELKECFLTEHMDFTVDNILSPLLNQEVQNAVLEFINTIEINI